MGMRIPIKVATEISKKYGYDQVVITANNPNDEGWVTTHNKDKKKCKLLGKIGHILCHNLKYFCHHEEEVERFYKRVKDDTK